MPRPEDNTRPTEKRDRGEFALVAALVALALALRLFRIGWGLPGVYEEAMPFWKAWDLWGWGPGRHFDPNPHFFTYPSLTVYVQFVGQGVLYAVLRALGRIGSTTGFRILYETDKTPFLLAARAIGAAIGAATVVPVWALARRAGGRAAAVPAAFLVAVSPLLLARAQLVEVDVPLAFFFAVACVYSVRLAESGRLVDAMTAGVAAGLAASAKYPGALALLPALAASLPGALPRRAPRAGLPAASRSARRASGRGRSAGEPPARSAAPWATALRRAVVIVAAFAIAFAATSPFVLLDAGAAMREVAMAGGHVQAGHFGDAPGPAWLAYVRDWATVVMGAPLALASLAGLVLFAFVRRERWAVVLAWGFVPYALLVGSWARTADYYLLPLVPAGTVFAAALVAWLARRATAGRPAAAAAAIALATAVCAAPLVAADVAHYRDFATDSRTRARAWIEAHVPPGSLIVTEVLGPELTTARRVLDWDADLQRALRSAGYRPPIYAVEYLAMIAAAPEMSARFYDLDLYAAADYLIVTGSVHDRYAAQPERFGPQLGFYRTLERSWVRVLAVPSSGTGCDITVYRNPAHDRPFASRPPDPLPRLRMDDSTTFTGEEQALYWNIGVNDEWAGFLVPAAAAYRQGLAYPSNRPERYAAMAWHMAQCLVRAGRTPDALAALAAAEPGAPTARETQQLREYQRVIARSAAQ